jgi:hypothetical protein
MSTNGSCVRCGAVLASDQEYCLDCGTRRSLSPRSPWRTPLIAAAVTGVIVLAVMLVAYERMRSDAEGEANGTGVQQQRVSGPAPASGQATSRGGSRRPREEPPAQPPSP